MSSKRLGIRNPLSVLRDNIIDSSSCIHRTILNYRGLKELFEIYDFTDMTIEGAGYYPFSSMLGRLDVRHSHFITLKGHKNEKHYRRKTN